MRQLNKFSSLFFLAVLFSLHNYAQVDSPLEAKVSPPITKIETEADRQNKPPEKIEQYWFVILKTGPKQDFDSTAKTKLFEGHMANIFRLYNEGILKVAGPFGKNDFKWRGIFIFDCKTKEEAEKIVSTDPAVAAGLFAVDIVPWFSEPIGSFKHGKPAKTTD